MFIHERKCWPGEFYPITHHDKTFEFREEDSIDQFEVSDWIILREWEPESEAMQGEPVGYTGSVCLVSILFINRGPDFNIPEGYCAMSIHLIATYWAPDPAEEPENVPVLGVMTGGQAGGSSDGAI